MNDDLISRQAAIELSCNVPIAPLIQGESVHYEDIIFTDHIKSLPIVQPEQKTGRWIYKERNILINTGRVSYGENGAVQEKRWTKVKKRSMKWRSPRTLSSMKEKSKLWC